MALPALVRRSRTAAPLIAFVATALLATVLAAQAQLICSHEMIMAMPGMPAMDMNGMAGMGPAGSTVALCPVVLVLGIAAALLCANAAALLVFDRHRALTGRTLARICARLPLASTALTVLTLGSAAVGSMMAIDRSIPPNAPGWLQLAAIVAGIAVAATVVAIGAARCALALTRRIAVAIACAIEILTPRVPAAAFRRAERVALVARRAPVLAARRGLRAPPFSAR
jgi:hypothetical protein